MKPCRVASAIAAAGLIAAAFPGRAAAESPLRVEPSGKAVRNRVEVSLIVRNTGSEPVYDVRADVVAGWASWLSPALPVIPAGEASSLTRSLPLKSRAPGRHPLVVRLSYADASQYPSGTVSAATFSVGGKDPLCGVWAELLPLRFERSGRLRLRLRELDDRPASVLVRLFLPDPLAADRRTAQVELSPGQQTEVSFGLRNATAILGRSFEVAAAVEYEDAGVRRTAVARGTVEVGRTFPAPVKAALAVAAMVLLMALIALNVRGPDAASARLRGWVDAAVLAGTALFLLYHLPPRLLLSGTTTAGGDTPSHIYTLKYLLEQLLPLGRVTGWCPGNFAGFPMLEFYFPLPFLVMAGLSWLMPMQVAFKLGTVLGLFLLPPAAYACLRLMRQPFPAPALAAAATLPFMFMEANSIWGGNIPSTLAGEFAYSLGLSLAVLWMGTLFRGMELGRHAALNAALLALVGFSHGYTLLFAGAWSLSFLLRRETFAVRAVYLAKVHGAAFLLLGFWLVPLIARLPWTTAYDYMLPLKEYKSILPPVLSPLLFLAACGLALDRGPASRSLGAAAVAGLALFAAGPGLGVVDLRFLPFFQLSLALLSAVGASAASRNLRGKALVPLIALACAVLWSQAHVVSIPTMVDWNYAGYEPRPLWPVFDRVNRLLKGTSGDPRVVFEHSPRNASLGSIRSWECLPLFSGRSTLEHAYFQGSPAAPFVFFLQSEVSFEAACPFPSYACARLDLQRALRHLRLFNVRELIAVSDTVKAALRGAAGYRLKAEAHPFAVYEVEGTHRYVEPLTFEPVLWTGPEPWKEAAYRWFRTDSANDVHLVFNPGAQRYGLRASSLAELPRVPVRTPAPPLWERVGDDEIEFEAAAVGKPHLVKVSYHPGWRVEGADAVRLVSPAFMLVVPNRPLVRLRFARTRADWAGIALTGLGLVLALALGRSSGISRAAAGLLERAAAWPRPLSLSLLALLAGAGVLRSIPRRVSASDVLLEKALEHHARKDWAKADRLLERIARGRPLSRFAEQARYHLGTSKHAQGDCVRAVGELRGFLESFPDSLHAPEAERIIGECGARAGRPPEAAAPRASRFSPGP